MPGGRGRGRGDGVATQALIFNPITATAAAFGSGGMPKQAQNVCLSGKTGSKWPPVKEALLTRMSWSAAAKKLDGIQKMSVHFAFEAHRLLLVNDLDLNRSFRLHMPTNFICPQ